MSLRDEFIGVNRQLDTLTRNVAAVEKDARKNFLVSALAQAERGQLNAAERLRFYELYDIYINNGGNTYIKETFERLHGENKI